MKKRLLINIATLIALAIGISSCGDDEKGSPGKFTLDGETFKLTKGFATLDGIDEVGDDVYYYWTFVLTSSSLDLNDDDDFEGTGDAVVLQIRAANDDGLLPAGTYDSDDLSGWCEGVYVEYNVETGSGDEYDDVSGVLITISKSGDTFTINFTITLEDESVITGSYKGAITEIEG